MIRISRKTRHNVTYLYHLHVVALDFVTEMKYLGVIITADLRWNRHVADVVNRENKVLGMIRRNIYFCDKKTKDAAYAVGLVRALLEYASAVWDPHTASLASELEKIQRKAARFVTSDYLNFEHGTMTRHLHIWVGVHLEHEKQAVPWPSLTMD